MERRQALNVWRTAGLDDFYNGKRKENVADKNNQKQRHKHFEGLFNDHAFTYFFPLSRKDKMTDMMDGNNIEKRRTLWSAVEQKQSERLSKRTCRSNTGRPF